MPIRVAPVVVLVLAGLLFFPPLLVRPDAVLYSDYSDFINYHIPCKSYLVRSVQQTGELPLWCPEMFAGMPFVHDPQVAAFYPLHAPLYLVPPQHVGAACSWLIVLHVIVAGLCMYAYARHRRLGQPGSLVAGLGYMFAGKWLLHLLVAGHFNVAPLAWLPLVLLWLEQAISRGSLMRAAAAGVVFAFIVLGTHPQLTFYAGLFVVLWTLGNLLAQCRERSEAFWWSNFGRWLGLGLLTAVIAGLLSAVQILPALEATAASSRTLGVPLGSNTLHGCIRTLIASVGPPVTTDSSWLWEDRLAFGLVWLALAACAPLLDSRPSVRFAAGITLLWFLLGLGGVTLLQWLPGFHLWRLPSRMFLLAALPVSLLAATSVDRLLAGPAADVRERCRSILVKAALFILVPLAIHAMVLYYLGHQVVFTLYWPLLLATVPLAWCLLGKDTRVMALCDVTGLTMAEDSPGEGEAPAEPTTTGGSTARQEPRPPVGASLSLIAVGWVLVLLADLWGIAWPLVAVYPEAELYAPGSSVQYLQERAGDRGRVLDIGPINPANPDDVAPACATPLWPNLAMVAGVEPVRGYNPLDVLRYKEYLQFVMDTDEPLRALHNFTMPGPGGFPIVSPELANLLGVRYLLMPTAVPLDWFVTDTKAREQSWKAVHHEANPRAYSFVPTTAESLDAGIRELPGYTIYENRNALPRAFFVPEAKALPDHSRVLAELKATDFRRCVLLEGFDPASREHALASRERQRPGQSSMATLRDYHPNRVVIEVQAAAPGFVVLADPWFPGWGCTVDGAMAPIYRANFLFRAVEVPAGNHEVVFTFAPRSYAWGKIITLLTLGFVGAGMLFAGFWRRASGATP